MELHPLKAESTDSASTFDQIGKWMDRCLGNHSSCRNPGPSDSERPTRLILIDPLAGFFQLVTKFAPETKYAAVSYRWGSGGNSYMLTRETAQGMRQGVSIALLPKTLIDTFSIAHRLGLKYVWIDRLCIFQDSREDWNQEASRMAFIYKYAFLTIAAACASQESQGCFRKRNIAGIQPWWLTSNPLLPSLPMAGHHESSYITSDEPLPDQREGGKLGYLADRGWVFQERVLSQRIVHFAEEEVHWECKELEASEAWPEYSEYFSTLDRPSVLYGPGNEVGRIHGLWQNVARQYSTCQFTYDADKLPALSGLARETAELRKDEDEYLAGLWRSTVHSDLCWMVRDHTPRRPEEYLAPSWSWASLHARITHIGGNAAKRPANRPVAAFKDARLKFATTNSYGAVQDGLILLFGHLKQVMVVRIRPPKVNDHWNMRVRHADGSRLPFLNGAKSALDIESFAAGGSGSAPMFCLPVMKTGERDPETEQHPKFICLLLVPNGSIKYITSREALPSPETQYADEYQRAGLAILHVRDWLAFKAWLQESPERDIVIR